MKTCINCGHINDSPYCPNCGQKMDVKRVTFRGILEEFVSKWIGLDNQFGRTVKDMTIKPGSVVHSYLKGNRVKYLGPLGYVVIMTALLAISFDLFGVNVKEYLEDGAELFQFQANQNQPMTPKQQEFQRNYLEFWAKNFRFLSVIVIPFFAITVGWHYRREKLNYVERIALTTYLFSHSMWITFFSIFVLRITGSAFQIHTMIISIVYYSYAMHKIFPRKIFLVSFIKTFGSWITAFLLPLIFALVITLIVILAFQAFK